LRHIGEIGNSLKDTRISGLVTEES